MLYPQLLCTASQSCSNTIVTAACKTMHFVSTVEKSHLLESKEFRLTRRSVSDSNAIASENHLWLKETGGFIPVEKSLSSEKPLQYKEI